MPTLRTRTILLFIVLALYTGILFSAPRSGGLEFSGSLYTDLGAAQIVQSGTDSWQFNGTSMLSASFRNRNREHAKVEGLVDLIVPYGSRARALASTIDTLAPASPISLMPGKSTLVLADIRKLYLSIYTPLADITLGRTIVNYGTGVLFSPIDLFSTVDLADIGFRRTGSDIAMVRIPFGSLAGIDLTAGLPVFDRTWTGALKAYATLGGWDLSLVGLYRDFDRDRTDDDFLSGGVAFKGDLLVGVYGESVVRYEPQSHETAAESMIGADYSIHNRVFFTAEYLYAQMADRPSVWGEHNVFGSIAVAPSDLVNISASLIRTLNDYATIGVAQVSWNVLQNTDLSLYVQGLDNKRGRFFTYSLRAEVSF